MAIDTLLDNAVKFAREGSVVEVTVQALKDHMRIEIANEEIRLARRNKNICSTNYGSKTSNTIIRDMD